MACAHPSMAKHPRPARGPPGALEAELEEIHRYRLIIIDEVGYVPFDQDPANLFFQLLASANSSPQTAGRASE